MDEVFAKPRKSLVRLFSAYLDKLAKMRPRVPEPFGTYYEFGTGWGGTLAAFMLAAEQIAIRRKLDPQMFQVYAFDSFEGLPPSEHLADRHKGWSPGAFAHSMETIQEKMKTHPFARQVPVTYVKGRFEDSLTDNLMREIEGTPPSIITVNVDFYTSTRHVLFWIDRFIASGALIYFDDMWAFHGHPEFGQIRAVREFNEKGDGHLAPFDTFGEAGKCFLYSRKRFEYC